MARPSLPQGLSTKALATPLNGRQQRRELGYRGKAKLFPKASALLGEGPELGSWPGLRPNFGLDLLLKGQLS